MINSGRIGRGEGNFGANHVHHVPRNPLGEILGELSSKRDELLSSTKKSLLHPKFRSSETYDIFDPTALPSFGKAKTTWCARAREHYGGFRFLIDNESPIAIFEIFTQEYVQNLARHIAEQYPEGATILEVGAGNGKLSHFLKKFLHSTSKAKFTVIATDDQSWQKNGAKTHAVFPVEDINYQEALKKYNPVVVISSWMPEGKNWTVDFRSTPSVREYILIGKHEVCGTNDTYKEFPNWKKGDLDLGPQLSRADWVHEKPWQHDPPIDYEQNSFTYHSVRVAPSGNAVEADPPEPPEQEPLLSSIEQMLQAWRNQDTKMIFPRNGEKWAK